MTSAQSSPSQPDPIRSAAPTIAMWTPPGRGAVATLKVVGDLAGRFEILSRAVPFRAANRKPLAQLPIGRIAFGHWGAALTEGSDPVPPAAPVEEVVACRVAEQEWEFHCHGGIAAARRILNDCVEIGFEPIVWQDQLRRSASQFQADIQLALTQATTLKTAGILLDQPAAWEAWGRAILADAGAERCEAIAAKIEHTGNWAHLGQHLLEPFRIVLTGPPNVGKSALLNALVGYQRSVVFDQPGTTRDVVTAEAAFEGWPVRLIDTAGLRDHAEGLEAAGIQLAYGQLAEADLILQVNSATDGEAAVETAADPVSSQTVFVLNKIDLLDQPPVLPQSGAIALSARTGVGLENLIQTIVARLVPAEPELGCAIPLFDYQRDWLHGLALAAQERSADTMIEIATHIVQSSARQRPYGV